MRERPHAAGQGTSGGAGARAFGARAFGPLVAAAMVLALAACQPSGSPAGTPRTAGTPANASGGASGAAAGVPARPRVVFLGTSLTAGLGLDPDSAYPALVARKADSAGTPLTAVNAGVSGETSAGALRRVDWVLSEPADVVVIETGANDGLRGQSPDSLRANLERIIARTRALQPRAQVALVQMEAPRNFGAGYTARFHDVYPAVARSTGVTLFPFLLDGVAGVPRLNQPDGVHPTEEGARRVADNVWRALAPLLARPVASAVGAAGVAASP
jgi:acyl-CoA thioesterase-1